MRMNINDYVFVHLTDEGREIIAATPNASFEPQSNGAIKLQLHELMRVFGPHVVLGRQFFKKNEIKL